MASSIKEDVIYTKVIFNPGSISDEEGLEQDEEDNGPIQLGEGMQLIQVGTGETIVPEKGQDNNIWSVNDYALRDLLVFLVQKYKIDEVYDSKVKAQNWEKLIEEFHFMTEHRVTVSKPQIVRKWHNWKQYNKARKKPHPFVVSEGINQELVIEKCSQLCDRAKRDPEFAALLSRGPVEAFDANAAGLKRDHSDSENEESNGGPSKKPNLLGLSKLRSRDFLVRRTGASAAALSLKRLQHEITLENLNFEYEKWRIKLENNQLLQQKILKQSELMDVRLDKAETEFNYKKNVCLSMGITVTDTDYKAET